MKIIVATDFSENAQKALDFTLVNFNEKGTEYVLLHASYIRQAGETLTVDLDEEASSKTAVKLRQYCEEIKERYPDIWITSMTKAGNLANVLVHTVEEENADMVVMGTNGVTGLYEKMIGSNTEEVMNVLECPLMVVPFSSEVKKIDTMEVAIEKVQRDLKAIEFSARLGKSIGANVHLLHLFGPDEDPENFDIPSNLFEGSHLAIVQIQTSSPDLEKVIHQFSEKDAADLIVVIPHHRSFLKGLFHRSVTENLLKTTRIPLLII
ncbi:MAG: universal stress protein [Flavobacteriales bacterium]|nr:universal stress protein [Flavobacteriales bacterium]